MNYIFVTSSLDKALEAERILGATIERREIDLPELQSTDVQEVVATKAQWAYKAVGGRPVIVEDTGLYLHAWNGLPGALVRWFLQCVGDRGICTMMGEFPDRSAWAESALGIYDGQLRVAVGRVYGHIPREPAGTGGFGWDSIFVPAGSNKTFAEMTPLEKDRYSMRQLALEAMKEGKWQQ